MRVFSALLVTFMIAPLVMVGSVFYAIFQAPLLIGAVFRDAMRQFKEDDNE